MIPIQRRGDSLKIIYKLTPQGINGKPIYDYTSEELNIRSQNIMDLWMIDVEKFVQLFFRATDKMDKSMDQWTHIDIINHLRREKRGATLSEDPIMVEILKIQRYGPGCKWKFFCKFQTEHCKKTKCFWIEYCYFLSNPTYIDMLHKIDFYMHKAQHLFTEDDRDEEDEDENSDGLDDIEQLDFFKTPLPSEKMTTKSPQPTKKRRCVRYTVYSVSRWIHMIKQYNIDQTTDSDKDDDSGNYIGGGNDVAGAAGAAGAAGVEGVQNLNI